MHRKTAAFKRLQPLFVHFQPFQPVLFSTDKFVTKYLLAIYATIRLRNRYVTVLPKHCCPVYRAPNTYFRSILHFSSVFSVFPVSNPLHTNPPKIRASLAVQSFQALLVCMACLVFECLHVRPPPAQPTPPQRVSLYMRMDIHMPSHSPPEKK